jgi:hypothetical protein
MVRRAQLQRKTGSPLISGYLTPKGVNWGWIVAAVLAVAIVAAAYWYFWLR